MPKVDRKPRRRSPLRAVLFILVVGAIAGAVWYFSRPKPVEVILWAADRGRVESTVANTRAGTVKASRRANLAPSAGGTVALLPVREGDRVKKDSTLLELWNDDVTAQVQLAEAQARAADARAEEACLVAAQAERDARRQRRLREQGIASEDVVEAAESRAESTKAACAASRAGAEEWASSVAVARASLEKTVLKAPFDGVVARLNVELGEYVTPSPPGIPTPPAVDLIEDGVLYVEAPIDEVDAPQVAPGLSATVTLDAFPGREFPGKIRRVAPYVLDVEKQARTVDVEVEIQLPPGSTSLLPGFSADVEVLIDDRPDVLRLPTEAILEGNKVLVFVEGVLAEKEIRTGIANWEYTEIVAGLDPGDSVVLSIDREGVVDGAHAVVEKTRSDRTRTAGGGDPKKPETATPKAEDAGVAGR